MLIELIVLVEGKLEIMSRIRVGLIEMRWFDR